MPTMKNALRFGCGLAAGLFLMTPAHGRSLDDVVLVVGGEHRTLPVAELLANDFAPTTGGIEITSPPLGASVQLSADGSDLVIQLDPGTDLTSFHYRNLGADMAQETEVLLVSVPKWQPVAGRLPTYSCPETDSCKELLECHIGAGSEIGWFHIPERKFGLCDFDGTKLKDCVDIPLPVDSRPWLPLVADLDGNGWDEIGVSDPATGKVLMFSYDLAQCEAGSSGCLTPVLDTQFPSGALVAGGDWNGDGVGELRAYHQRLGFSPSSIHSPYANRKPIVGSALGLPVVTGWGGSMKAGLWLPSLEQFELYHEPGIGISTVNLFGAWPYPGLKVRGTPLTFPAAACSDDWVIGLFDEPGGQIVLSAEVSGDPVVHMCVPVDPDGYPGAGPVDPEGD
ncbi:MAG: hypothetical protein AAGD06_21000 [Acidobacteriota bacterium]